jgi:hypothetical protein
MPKPTKEDARLLLKLVEISQSDSLREADRWLMSDFSAKDYQEFVEKYPMGSKEFQQAERLLGFFETAGVLVSQKLLNEDLFFDLGFGIDEVWGKLGPIISGWQKVAGPALLENAVWLHDRHVEWQKKVWKPGLRWKLKAGSRRK